MSDKFLLVKGISGMGNRILSALTGSLYAQLAGRQLVIDWSDEYYSLGAGLNAFHRFFLSPLCDPGTLVPDTSSIAPAIWQGRLQESAWRMRSRHGNTDDSETWRRFSIDLNRIDHPETIAVMWLYSDRLDDLRMHFRGAWEERAAGGRVPLLRKLLEDTLTLHPDIREGVDRFKQSRFRGRTVGVHVRYTDYRTSLWTVLRTLDALRRSDPAVQIFVATDNARVARMFERRYPHVISTPRWYAPDPGEPLHFGEDRPNPISRGIEALTDLYLLAECDDLIVDTSSSFADVAMLLAKAPTDRIIDVRRRGKRSPLFRRASYWSARKIGLYGWGPDLLGRLSRW